MFAKVAAISIAPLSAVIGSPEMSLKLESFPAAVFRAPAIAPRLSGVSSFHRVSSLCSLYHGSSGKSIRLRCQLRSHVVKSRFHVINGVSWGYSSNKSKHKRLQAQGILPHIGYIGTVASCLSTSSPGLFPPHPFFKGKALGTR